MKVETKSNQANANTGKKDYQALRIKIMELQKVDIVRTSDNSSGENNWGEWDPT